MRVFGIDPGSYTTGYGIVEKQGRELVHVDNGIVRPKGSESFPKRLCDIYEEICRLIDEFKPDIVALEDVFVAKNVKTAMRLGHVRGVAMLAAVAKGIEVVEYQPVHVKQAITGVGSASKEQVAKMVKVMLKLPDVAAEDASDALAVAICHLNSALMRKIQGI
jgi:crossover junction endodeoxyribonuclease RuvC